ncbi:DUF4389 domain-containing protein [Streptacidiphilus fuscans]|uniref:DUF4389 domain-containing protein n=1 Tax=Streptacidiphilus fuscans TaxID=2789292 RepID=A0A931FFV1_9ACTN|nr:DUF4389 domain-containing protein [Streptacidiphilus fuscans]MBF9068779.1 DUF4389 domain-containing protein [Streptacidiphilus fuscans]
MAYQTWSSPPPLPNAEAVPELDVPEPGAQRRWTVLLRWLLLIPQWIVLTILGILGFLAVVVGWFAALVLGRLPGPIHSYLAGLLVYQTRVQSYAMLLVDRYPPFAFDAPEHPVQVELRPATSLNRLAVFFRLLLMIPAGIVQGLVTQGWYVVGFFLWLITLVLGRLPRPAFEATAATVRFSLRFQAYASMLTPAYPKRLFGDDSLTLTERRSASRPLLLSGGGRALVVLFLLLGLLGSVSTSYENSNGNNTTTVDQPSSAAGR